MECEKAAKIKCLLSSFVVSPEHRKNESLSKRENLVTETNEASISAININYRDRSSFLKRIKSYTPLNWFAKPSWLSPPVCARYGWENAAHDMLQCVTCRAYVSGKMPSSYQPNIYNECCRKLEDSLKTAHHPYCTWSTNPSPESYLRIEMPQLIDIRKELTLLISYDKRLPKFEEETFLKLNVLVSELKKLQQRLELLDCVDSEVFISACILAICGWKAARSAPKSQLLSCSYCSRECGLWSYISIANDSSEDSDNDEDLFSPLKKTMLYASLLNKSPAIEIGKNMQNVPNNAAVEEAVSDTEAVINLVGSKSDEITANNQTKLLTDTGQCQKLATVDSNICEETKIKDIAIGNSEKLDTDKEECQKSETIDISIGEQTEITDITNDNTKNENITNKSSIYKSEGELEPDVNVAQDVEVKTNEVNVSKSGEQLGSEIHPVTDKHVNIPEQISQVPILQDLSLKKAEPNMVVDFISNEYKNITENSINTVENASDLKTTVMKTVECDDKLSHTFDKKGSKIAEIVNCLISKREDTTEIEHATELSHLSQEDKITENSKDLLKTNSPAKTIESPTKSINMDTEITENKELESTIVPFPHSLDGTFDDGDNGCTETPRNGSDSENEDGGDNESLVEVILSSSEDDDGGGGADDYHQDEEISPDEQDISGSDLVGEDIRVERADVDGNEEDFYTDDEDDSEEGDVEMDDGSKNIHLFRHADPGEDDESEEEYYEDEQDKSSDKSDEIMILSSDSEQEQEDMPQSSDEGINDDSQFRPLESPLHENNDNFCDSKDYGKLEYSNSSSSGPGELNTGDEIGDAEFKLHLEHSDDIGQNKNEDELANIGLNESEHNSSYDNTSENRDQSFETVENVANISKSSPSIIAQIESCPKNSENNEIDNELKTDSEKLVTEQQIDTGSELVTTDSELNEPSSSSDYRQTTTGVTDTSDTLCASNESFSLSSQEKIIEVVSSADATLTNNVTNTSDDITDDGTMEHVSSSDDAYLKQKIMKENTFLDASPAHVYDKKRKRKPGKVAFNPFTEHRDWCPWVTEDAYSSSLSFSTNEEYDDDSALSKTWAPGWSEMVGKILPKATPEKEDLVQLVKTSPPYESLRRIRTLFHDWASPQVKVKVKL